MLKFLKVMGSGLVTLMNLTVMGILVGFAAYAASATLNVDSGEKTKDIDTVKTTIVETIDISNRKDIEFFLIDPY